MSDKDNCRRWTQAIAQLRSRAAKARRAPLSADGVELIDQSLGLCDEVVRELAGHGLQFDEYRMKLDAQAALFAHFFEEMPTPCIETDASGIILGANRAASHLLNTSVKHLSARLLMHFAEDREQFGQLLRDLSSGPARPLCTLTVRPRERAPIVVEATVIPRRPGEAPSWFWFFTRIEPPRSSRPERPIRQEAARPASLQI